MSHLSPAPLQAGDVLHYSWGYDQTNCEFFEVVRASEKSVWLKPIAAQQVPGSDGFMSCSVVPAEPRQPASYCSVELKGPKRISVGYKGVPLVSMPHGIADKWDGKPCYSSWYA